MSWFGSQALPQYSRLHPTKTMQAVVIDAYGPPEALHLATVPRPVPGRGEILVKTTAVAVNPKDIIVRSGKFSIGTGHRFPLIIGNDLCGEIVEAGPGATLAAGERVFAMKNSFSGTAYAEYVALPAKNAARAPRTVDDVHAAAIPLAGQTALQAVRDLGDVRAGDALLINGASGGVGAFAVQIGRILGARVTAVCSARNHDFVRELGAHEAIDYKATDITTLSERYDTVFDVFGNYDFGQLGHLLTPDGTYIHTIPKPRVLRDVVLTFGRRQRAKLVVVWSNRNDLDWLAAQVDRGALRPVVDRTWPLDDAAEAHRYVAKKRTRGKVVLTVS